MREADIPHWKEKRHGAHLLGHVSVRTTEIYAKTDAKLKRAAIEAASKELVPPEDARWDNDEDLKSWLKNFNRR